LSSPKVIESLVKAVEYISIGKERAARGEEEGDAYDGDDELPVATKRKARAKTTLEKEIHVSWCFLRRFADLTSVLARAHYVATSTNKESG
jgi:hypothetical protein